MFTSLHGWTLIIREMVEWKAFLANSKHQYHVSREEEYDCCAYNKGMEIITSIQVCLISWMNINYDKNGGMKSFSSNARHQYHVSQWEEHDCNADNKRNGDYYQCPSFSHFTGERHL